MRYVMFRVTGILTFVFFFSAGCLAQGNLHINESAIRIQLLDQSTEVELTIENAARAPILANVTIELINPLGLEQSHANKEVSLQPGKNKVNLSMPPAFAQNERADKGNLLWYRLRYSIAANSVSGAPTEALHGVLSVSEAVPNLFDLHVAAPQIVKAGERAAIRVRAVHPLTLHPIEGVTVQASLDVGADDNKPLLTPSAKTDRQGFATLTALLPHGISTDEIDVTVTGKLGDVSVDADSELNLDNFTTIMLSTDKPLYQPGQPLHMRLMVFDADHKAFAGKTIQVQVRDPDETMVFRADAQTSRFGVATADWQIPENLRLGDYRIQAISGEDDGRSQNANASVKISRYDLPNFSVGVKPDHAYYLPGQNAEMEVRADYLFGEPVRRGHVRVVQESERRWNFREQKWDIKEEAAYEGDTDDQGHYVAHVSLSAAHDELSGNDYARFRDISFAAYYTDSSTGRTEQRRFDVRITRDPIHIYFIEPNYFQPSGLPIEFFISTENADGTPAECDVELRWIQTDARGNPIGPLSGQILRRVRTNRYGIAKVTNLNIPMQSSSSNFSLNFLARDRKGLVGSQTESSQNSDHPGVRVSTDKTLYSLNQPIYAELAASTQDIRLVVDAVHDSQVLASQLVHVRHGHASVFFPANEKFQNEVTILAYALGTRNDESYDNIFGTRTVFFPKNHELSVEIRPSKLTYRPGEEVSAMLNVTGPEGALTEDALGILVVDKAVEERARTDREFGGNSGFFYFRGDNWVGYEELNGVRRSDLEKLDLSKPLPDGYEVVADALLQNNGADPEIFTSNTRSGDLRHIFSPEINPLINPLQDALTARYKQSSEYPKTEESLRNELAATGMGLDNLLDPWGMPFRFRFGMINEMDILEIISAGPDKTFGTEDDFQVLRMEWPYFKPNAEAIQKAVDEYHARTGGYIRDEKSLKNELARRGIDLNSLKDPWNHVYRYEFGVNRTNFTITVSSAGPDGRFDTKTAPSVDDFSLGTTSIDYFGDTNAKIDAALNKVFKDTHAFPEDMDQLTRGLQNSGIYWDALKDPWGRPFYAVFRQDAMYADRIKMETYESHIGKALQHTEIVPVTRQMNYLYLRSAGEDGIEGTADDFYVAAFSRASFERTGHDQNASTISNSIIFSGASGAISGTVIDASRAAIPETEVTAKNISSGQTFTAKTDDSGNYVLRNLPAGIYTVEFISTGFRDAVITEVPVRSSNATNLDATLEVGSVTQEVTVTAEAAQVNMTMSTELPLNGRSYSSLISLARGAAMPARPESTSTPRLREYFPETLLWQPEIVTDSNGRARLKFPLADNITTWKVSAIASTKTGEIGTAEKEIRAFQPFFVEHDPPKFLTTGDEIELPVVLRNYLDHNLQMTTELKPETWFTSMSPTSVKTVVPARDSTSEVFKFQAAASIKNGKQRIVAKGAEVGDAMERAVTVRPNGEEHVDTTSQILGDSVGVDIRIPDNAIPGSLEGTLKIYPNLNAHVLESIEGILERPYGCAEQTISSAYPSLLYLQYAKDLRGVSPAIVARAKRYVELGYGRLLSYQAADGGITYWGRGDSDPALTAYALKFLSSAREFANVDDSIAQQNLSWLVSHEQDDGRWIATTWGGPEDVRRSAILTAYIARVLAATKVVVAHRQENDRLAKSATTAVARSLDYLQKQSNASDEPYLIASYALASFSAGDKARFTESLERLRKLEHREGNYSYWSLETNTPFYGWGLTGRIETTAIVLQAFEESSEANTSDEPVLSRGLLFLLRNQDPIGIWFSTQATVNVLETLHSFTSPSTTEETDSTSKSNPAASILVDGRPVLTLNMPNPDELSAPVIADISKYISAGPHHVEISRGAASAKASLQLIADYYVPWTHTGKNESVQHEDKSSDMLRLQIKYDNPSSKVGESIRCNVEAERIGFHGYGMMLAEIGLPPGAEVDRDSIEKAMKESSWDINQYEVLPDRLVVYLWPHAGGTKFSFTFKPRFGLKALTRPSTLYDYYNPDAQAVVEPTQFFVN
ncbi:MAG TPA: alpha-2-macroglobulin family protein [Candidatus Saccharimonadales bacterium]|jgi:hypothetical protein|nr:alpha-2-macroglobulin family protein [Candidatus Saccharimonadales bacterium]